MSQDLLVVDDEEIVTDIISEFLTASGKILNIDRAANGKEALKKCVEKKYSTIFVDFRMPIMSGGEFVKIIRETACLNQATPIIFITANEEEAEPYSVKYPGIVLITKPVQLKKLISAFEFVNEEE